jgi:acyl-coenzyme A thioesterase PaaI-like protein
MWKEDAQRQLKAVSSPGSPIGFKLKFELEGNTARTEFTLSEDHQGRPGFVHDGLIPLIMDIGMGWVSRHGAGVNSVTAKMDVDFQNPARIGEPLIMVSRITRNTSRLVEVAVQIQRPDGTVLAEGTCLQYVMAPNPDYSHLEDRKL